MPLSATQQVRLRNLVSVLGYAQELALADLQALRAALMADLQAHGPFDTAGMVANSHDLQLLDALRGELERQHAALLTKERALDHLPSYHQLGATEQEDVRRQLIVHRDPDPTREVS